MESSRLPRALCNGHEYARMRFHLFAKCASIAFLPTCNGSIIIKNYYNLFHFKIISHIIPLLLLRLFRFYFAFVAVIYHSFILLDASFSCLLSAALNRCYLRISIFIALLFTPVSWNRFSGGKLHAWLWHSISISFPHMKCDCGDECVCVCLSVCVVFDFGCHKSTNLTHTQLTHTWRMAKGMTRWCVRSMWDARCGTNTDHDLDRTPIRVRMNSLQWLLMNESHGVNIISNIQHRLTPSGPNEHC